MRRSCPITLCSVTILITNCLVTSVFLMPIVGTSIRLTNLHSFFIGSSSYTDSLGRTGARAVWEAGKLSLASFLSFHLSLCSLPMLFLLMLFSLHALSSGWCCPFILSSQAQVHPLTLVHLIGFRHTILGENTILQMLVTEANGGRIKTLKTHLPYPSVITKE